MIKQSNPLNEKKDERTGIVQGHRDGFGFVIPDDGKLDIFLSEREMARVMHGDRVIVRITGTDRKGNYRTTIKRISGQAKSNAAFIKIQWRGDTNSEIVTVGSGRFDYDFMSMGDGATISNPEANPTGNLLISTTGLAANEGFTLFIDLRKDGRDYDSGQTADPTAFNRGRAAP
jgi:exoribonuclease R